MSAKNWFENEYIGKFLKLKIAGEKKGKVNKSVLLLSTQHIIFTGSTCSPNCHEVNVTLTTTTTLCFNEGGYPSGFNPNAFEQAPPDSGGGAAVIYAQTRQYSPQRAVCNPNGQDRADMNQSLSDVVTAVGLSASITSWSFDKADALDRSIGAEVTQHFPLAGTIGKRLGFASLAIDGYQLAMGVYEDGFQWELDKDLGSALQAGLGVTALFVALWAVVVLGGISIGLAVYAASSSHSCN